MFRIEQLEGRLGGGEAGAAAPGDGAQAAQSRAVSAAGGAAPAPPPRTGGGEGGSVGAPVAAAAAAAEPDLEPAPALELELVQELWPAVAAAVAEQNGMLGAALAAARPVALEHDRLTVAFPPDAAFVKKKAEAGREVIQTALGGLTGRSVGLAFELSDDAAGAAPTTLDEAELIERLRSEFGAEEVFDDQE
jgi:hypothetical protein